MASAMPVPSAVMRVASQAGTRPPCSGRSATPDRFTLQLSPEPPRPLSTGARVLQSSQAIRQYVHNVTKTTASTLAEFELLVMVAAMRLGGEEAHAVSIAADITERTGRPVRRANVYTTLQRLEDKGLLTTALGESRPERGGKPRRVVAPTREGLAAVRATMAAITAMTRGVRI